MAFEKGKPRPISSGRKPGSKNKKSIIRVKDLLAERDINPAQKILELIPELPPWDQIDAWMDLLSYCEAKPKAMEFDPSEDEFDEDFEDIETERLLKVLKSPNGA
jgi:hypothetical protein